MTTNNLTEQWKKGELEEGHYYLKDNEYTFIDHFNGVSFKETCDFEIKEVLAPVPSYEEYDVMSYRSSRFSVRHFEAENQSLKEKLEPFTDPYFRGLTTKDIAELAKKSIRLTTQHCEDNAHIEKLEELLKNVTDEYDIEKQKALLKINELSGLLKECREVVEFTKTIVNKHTWFDKILIKINGALK